MLPVVQVGSAAIQLPGLILLAGVWVATLAVERAARGREPLGTTLANMILVALVAGLVGARVGYALRLPGPYLERPLDLLSLHPSALDAVSGMVAACLASWVYGRRKGLELWTGLDGLTPGFAVLAISLGLAHLASGDAFGAPTEVPWAIELWGARRHPSQAYELIAALLGLMLVYRLGRLRSFPGFLFLAWTAWMAVARLVVEGWRGDSVLILGGLRAAQVVSLVIVALALAGLHRRARTAQLARG